MSKHNFTIQTRQKSEILVRLGETLDPSGIFESPVKKVDGYSGISIFVTGTQPIRVRVEEACTEDGTFGLTETLASTLDPDSGLYVICERVFTCGAFAKFYIDNLDPVADAAIDACISGVPVGASSNSGGSSPDIYGPTRIVSLIAGEGTDLTIASAVAALPSEGGLIQLKQGIFPFVATQAMSDKNIVIRGAGEGATIIDIGANAIPAFTIPTGLTAQRTFVFEDLRIMGSGAALQRAFSVQDVNSLGVLILNRVETYEIRHPFEATAGSGTKPVLIYASDCYFQQVAGNTSILIVNSPAFPGVNLTMNRVRFYRVFQDAVVGALTQGGFYTDFTNVNIIAKDSQFSNGSVDCNVGAINLENCYIYNKSGGANTRIGIRRDTFSAIMFANAIVGCDFYFVSFDVHSSGNPVFFADSRFDSCAITDNNRSHISSCHFQGNVADIALVISTFSDTLISNCTFDFGAGGTSYVVDNARTIIGCTFDAGIVASVHLTMAGGRETTITGCVFFGGVPILETGSFALRNEISNCRFIGLEPTLTATSKTSVNGVNRVNITAGATTGAFVTQWNVANTRGVMAVGTIKNTGGANNLEVKETVIDAFGTAGTFTQTVTPGNSATLNAQITVGAAVVPYVDYGIAVRHPAAATTFDLQASLFGSALNG